MVVQYEESLMNKSIKIENVKRKIKEIDFTMSILNLAVATEIWGAKNASACKWETMGKIQLFYQGIL